MANCLRGALPPVDLRAVCFVRAILKDNWGGEKRREEEMEQVIHRFIVQKFIVQEGKWSSIKKVILIHMYVVKLSTCGSMYMKM